MFDNVNGFVPNSHRNGQESADSAEPIAHYSPLNGLTGGPLAEEPPGEPAPAPVEDVDGPHKADESVADVIFEDSIEDATLTSAEEPAANIAVDTPSEPVPQSAESAADEVEPVETPALSAEVALEPEAMPTDPEPEATLAEPPGDTAVSVEDGAEPLAEPDPTQPLPVGRPPSPLGLDAQIESLLFVADGPAPVAKLAEALEVKVGEVEAALAVLDERYLGRGIAIQRIKDRVQLTTSATAAPIIQRFLGLSATAPLSKAALETLAIIAYRQPITRPQIEQVRGVNSDSVIKNLLTKGLVEEAGIAEGPGRPVLYITTPEFLQHFGLSTLAELPELNLDDVRRSFASEILKG